MHGQLCCARSLHTVGTAAGVRLVWGMSSHSYVSPSLYAWTPYVADGVTGDQRGKDTCAKKHSMSVEEWDQSPRVLPPTASATTVPSQAQKPCGNEMPLRTQRNDAVPVGVQVLTPAFLGLSDSTPCLLY